MSYPWMTPLRAALLMAVCANPVLAQDGQGSAPVVGAAPVTLAPSPAFPMPAGWAQAMPVAAQPVYYVMPYMPSQQQVWPMQPMPAIPPGWIPFVMVLMPMPPQGVPAQAMAPAMPLLSPTPPVQAVTVMPETETATASAAPVVANPTEAPVSAPAPAPAPALVVETVPAPLAAPEVPPAITVQAPLTPEVIVLSSPPPAAMQSSESAPLDRVAAEPASGLSAPIAEAFTPPAAPVVAAIVPDAPATATTPTTLMDYGPVARTPVKWLVTRRAGKRVAVKKPRAHTAIAVRPVAAKPAPAKKRLCWSNGVVGPCP